MLVGLTGGIGAGKSTVAAMFADLGAVVVDADALAREALQPGRPELDAVVAAFGVGVLAPDGTLDRAALARRVFADPERLRRLEAVVHPYVERRSAALVAAAPPGAVVVHDVPLLVEKGLQHRYDAVVVVDAPDDTRLERLVARGLDRADAQARMAAQAGRQQRLAAADHVLVNDGGLDALRAAVARVWAALQR